MMALAAGEGGSQGPARSHSATVGDVQQKSPTLATQMSVPVINPSRSPKHAGRSGRRRARRTERKSQAPAAAAAASPPRPNLPPGAPEPEADGLWHSHADMGARLRVFSHRYGAYYACRVTGFDGRRKLHCCSYEDGDKKWHDMRAAMFEVLECGRGPGDQRRGMDGSESETGAGGSPLRRRAKHRSGMLPAAATRAYGMPAGN